MTGTLQSINLDYSDSKPIITLKLDSRAELDSIEGLKQDKLSIEIKKYRNKRSLNANRILLEANK